MKSDAFEARKIAVPSSSSGCPQRPIGVRSLMNRNRSGSCRSVATRGVSKYVGPMAFTWTLCGAHSMAITFVIWLIPPLLQAYASWLFIPTAPKIEETLMTFPRFSRIMCGATAWATRKYPFRLVSRTRSHSSSDRSRVVLRTFTPALFTRTSIFPKDATTASTARPTLSRRRTSIGNVSARTPSASAPARVSRSPSASRAHSARSHPAFASPIAIARPSPFEAPVTSAARPVRSNRSLAIKALPTRSYHEVFPDHLFVPPDLLHSPSVPDGPVFEDVPPPAHLPAELQVLVGEQDRHPLPVDPAENVHKVRHHQRREPLGRLVEQEQGRVRHQRPADPQHLLLAARQVDPLRRGEIREDREQLVHPLPVPVPIPPGEPARDLQVLLRGEIREDPQIVGHVRHAETGDLVRRDAGDLLPVKPDRPALRWRKPHDRTQGGGLADAVPPQQGDHLSLPHGEGNLLEDVARPVECVDVQRFEDHGLTPRDTGRDRTRPPPGTLPAPSRPPAPVQVCRRRGSPRGGGR